MPEVVDANDIGHISLTGLLDWCVCATSFSRKPPANEIMRLRIYPKSLSKMGMASAMFQYRSTRPSVLNQYPVSFCRSNRGFCQPGNWAPKRTSHAFSGVLPDEYPTPHSHVDSVSAFHIVLFSCLRSLYTSRNELLPRVSPVMLLQPVSSMTYAARGTYQRGSQKGTPVIGSAISCQVN